MPQFRYGDSVLINAYVLDSGNEDVGKHGGGSWVLDERDGGFYLVDWAKHHSHQNYNKYGSVWWVEDKEKFLKVLKWCQSSKQIILDRLDQHLIAATDWLTSSGKDDPDGIFETVVRLKLDENLGIWSPISFLWFEDEASTDIQAVIDRVEAGEDLTGYRLAPITFNMYDSWIYNTSGLSKLLDGIDLNFPIPTA